MTKAEIAQWIHEILTRNFEMDSYYLEIQTHDESPSAPADIWIEGPDAHRWIMAIFHTERETRRVFQFWTCGHTFFPKDIVGTFRQSTKDSPKTQEFLLWLNEVVGVIKA